jgi:hypothetical protein
MKYAERYRIKLNLFALFSSTVFLLFVGACCERKEPTRKVYGLTPMLEKTVETENLCKALALPSKSIFLETQISSKRESGAVTNIYSTQLSCREINLFFREQLFSKNWKIIHSDENPRFPLDSYNIFQLESFEIGIECNDIRDYCGTKKFYVSCSWHRLLKNVSQKRPFLRCHYQ